MQGLNFIALIPARFASTRFPGKPLAQIGGKTMIQRVYEQVSKSINDVFVATDDQRIYESVVSFGGKAIMTSENHRSGTDRCFEAYQAIHQDFDVIINIQGDEPFIQPEQIEELKNCFLDPKTDIATLVKKIAEDESEAILFNSNSPKVVISNNNTALYFSRSPIPYLRNYPENEWTKHHTFYKHIGIYAYTPQALAKISQLQPSELEIAESLEQLRWLQNGLTIKIGYTDVETIGIDTPEDLEKAEKLLCP
jgi:3-deoxy-manno-octulosonate cytidylyltransferase (CMP-KDO synthetase)